MFARLVIPVVLLLPLGLPSSTPPGANTPSPEVVRIQHHFDSVLVELETRDVSGLSASQQAARAQLVDVLAAYRERALFPRNYDFPGQLVPYFVDRKTGVRCAVAHLLDFTGRGDIVSRVAEADNNVWVPELAGDTEFQAWLSDNGLTLAEAARIQVPYSGSAGPEVAVFGSVVAAGTLPALATAYWNSRSNRDGHNSVGTVLGFATGALSLGISGLAASADGIPQFIAPLTLGAGLLTVHLSTRSLLRHRSTLAQRRESERERPVARVSIAPVPPTRHSGAGVMMHVSF